jgi:MFS family permease
LIGGAERVRLRDAFAVAEFRAVWAAQSQSRIGDQFARVALALAVFDRTASAALTALVYALTFLPPLLTASLLTGLADRYSRRDVMVVTDLARAGLVGVMAVPAVPLPGVVALLVLMTCLQPLFAAANNATLPTMVDRKTFPVAMSLIGATDSVSQIIGFTLGGVLVGLAGPRTALGLDAATFLVSAVLLRRALGPYRPLAVGAQRTGGRTALAGVRAVTGDRRLIRMVGLVWLYGLFLAPEALAAPFGHQIGVGPVFVGVLMAADLVGVAIGALLVARVAPARRQRIVVPLAAATGVPLVVGALAPSLLSGLLLWGCSGALASYMVLAKTLFTEAIPDGLRARVIGLASAGLQTSQGLGVLLAGGIAEFVQPSVAIAASGALGTAGAVAIGVSTRGSRRVECQPVASGSR